MDASSKKTRFYGQVKFQKLQSRTGDGCFFTMLLVIIIMMGLLIIMGFPKVIVGLEYITACPAAPYVPIYLLVSGLVGLLCPLYSVYVWMCVFDKMNVHNRSNVWMLIWIVMALAIPVVQLAGGPYIIYIFAKAGNFSTRCDVLNFTIGETQATHPYLQIEQKNISYEQNNSLSTKTLLSNATYVINVNKTDSDFYSTTSNFTICRSCDHVVMHCAIVTVIIEYSFVTLPMIVMSIAVMLFRRQYSKERGCCICC